VSVTIDTVAANGDEAPACELPATRRSLLRRATIASGALFAALAARGTDPASGHPGQGEWACCSLVREDQWCAPLSGSTPPFWCDHGGFKRVWYCCYNGYFYGCGECHNTTGDCFSGTNYYCSYQWLVRTFC
jgi:hypothetical protein